MTLSYCNTKSGHMWCPLAVLFGIHLGEGKVRGTPPKQSQYPLIRIFTIHLKWQERKRGFRKLSLKPMKSIQVLQYEKPWKTHFVDQQSWILCAGPGAPFQASCCSNHSLHPESPALLSFPGHVAQDPQRRDDRWEKKNNSVDSFDLYTFNINMKYIL